MNLRPCWILAACTWALVSCATARSSGHLPQALDTVQMWDIYGVPEAVLVRSRDMERPILLFVHGGPGMSFIPFSPLFDEGLLRDFTVVHWDQPGTGKSYSEDLSPSKLTIDRIIDDGLAVTREIARRAPERPIMLVGHSFGTVIALGMAQKQPELFARVFLVGTVGDFAAAEQQKWTHLTTHLAPGRRAELESLGPPPWTRPAKQLAAARLLVDTGAILGSVPESVFEQVSQKNPYYQADDWRRANEGSQLSLHALLPALQNYRAIEHYRRIEVPVTFVQGTQDMATPMSLARAYYDRLEAPKGKYWVEVPNAAHFVMWEAPEAFRQALLTPP